MLILSAIFACTPEKATEFLDNWSNANAYFIYSDGQSVEFLESQLEANQHLYTIGAELLDGIQDNGSGYPYNKVILLDGQTAFSTEEIASLQSYVEAGNDVFYFSSSTAANPELLQAFGMSSESVSESTPFVGDASYLALVSDKQTVGFPQDGYLPPVLVHRPISIYREGVDESLAYASQGLFNQQTDVALSIQIEAVGLDKLGLVAQLDSSGDYVHSDYKFSQGQGQFSAFGSDSLIVDHDASELVYAGPYIFNNCQFMMNMIGGGICTTDMEQSTVADIEFIDPISGDVLTEFTGMNGQFAIRATLLDNHVVQSAFINLPIDETLLSLDPENSFEIPRSQIFDLYGLNGLFKPISDLQDSMFNPTASMTVVSKTYTWAHLPEGENTFEVCAGDDHNMIFVDHGCTSVAINKSISSNQSLGRIRLKLPNVMSSETIGLILTEAGHSLPWADAHWNTADGYCESAADGDYDFDNRAYRVIESGVAGAAIFEEIEYGFPNLQAQMGQTQFAHEYQIDFSEMTLGEDEEGIDWNISGTTKVVEERYYQNPGDTNGDGACDNMSLCSDLIISNLGMPLIAAEMGMMTAELSYNASDSCGDDSFSGHTDTMMNVSQVNVGGQSSRQEAFSAAFFADVEADGFCIQLHSFEPLTSDNPEGEFLYTTAYLDIGDCSPN